MHQWNASDIQGWKWLADQTARRTAMLMGQEEPLVAELRNLGKALGGRKTHEELAPVIEEIEYRVGLANAAVRNFFVSQVTELENQVKFLLYLPEVEAEDKSKLEDLLRKAQRCLEPDQEEDDWASLDLAVGDLQSAVNRYEL